MKKIFSILFIVLACTGCKKFLDVEPKGRAILSGFEEYNGLLNNQYLGGFQNLKFTATSDAASGRLSYSFSILGEVEAPFYSSDDIVANGAAWTGYSLSTQKLYEWAPDVYKPEQNSPEWNAMYIQNYVYNLVANGVMEVTDATEEQKQELLAEARIARAYMHYWTAQLFSKPYNEATAATDPGIPIVTKASVEQTNFQRGTVKEVYDFIIKEITESLPFTNEITVNRNRISRLSGYSILAEVYFNMGKYNEALQQINLAMELVAKSRIPIMLYDYNAKINEWYIPFMANMGLVNFPNPFDSYESIYVKQSANPLYSAFAGLTVLSPEVWALFGPDDHRRKIFSDKGLFSSAQQLPGFQHAGPLTINMGPAVPNLYLMKAECEARAGQLSTAEKTLLDFRKTRMPEASAAFSYTDQKALVRLILQERQREFAATGRRWLDMRRLYKDADYNNLVMTRSVNGETFTLNPDRLTLRIPPMILNYNPTMKDNP